MKFEFVIFILVTLEKFITAQDIPVVLGSTLRQGSLCPGEDTATFTCSAVGTDLVWLVDGRTMAYNANARVGTLRSNALSDQTAILMRVEVIAGRVANRMSVLTITALPSATRPTTVRCHNGSADLAEEISFLRTVEKELGRPAIGSHLDLNGDRICLNWTAPDVNKQLQTINYYMVQLDNTLPMLIKNTSVVLLVGEGANLNVKIQAVDSCEQKGLESQVTLDLSFFTTEITAETETTDHPEHNDNEAEVFTTTDFKAHQNGASNGEFQLHTILLLLYGVSFSQAQLFLQFNSYY